MTYAGYDIIRPTPDLMTRIARWWDENAPELWTHPGYLTRGLDHLPIPGLPDAGRAPFNTLVWPSGASRWAVFHCLIGGNSATGIEQATNKTFTTSGCPNGAPFFWTIPLSGFTGNCSIANGTAYLTYNSGNTWLGVINGISVALVRSGTNWTLTIGDPSLGGSVTYTGTSANCCSAVTLTASSTTFCDGSPGTLTATPSGGCGGFYNLPATLLIKDSVTGVQVSSSMFVAGIRPVYVGGGIGTRAYWMTLVDARFFWWDRFPTFGFYAGDSWTTLLTNLVGAASGLVPTVPSIPAAYGTPAPNRWGVQNAPLPLLIDAAAAQVGLRFLFQPDGTASFVNSATATANDLAQYNAAVAISSPSYGGRSSVTDVIGSIPANVVVGFWGDNANYRTVSLSSLSLADYAGLNGVSNSYAWLMSDQNAAASSPSPASVATQMATDYYGWALSLTDATWAGIWNFLLTGQEDRIEWQYCPAIESFSDTVNNPLVDKEMPWVRELTRIVRPDWADRNVYGNRAPPGYTYSVKLLSQKATDSQRWKANIRFVSGGVITTGGSSPVQLGFGADDYALYVDPGSGEVGATGVAVPDPFINGAWIFQPSKKSSALGGGSCCDTSWTGGVPKNKCLNVVFLGGQGKCSCLNSDICTGSAACDGTASYKPTPMLYQNNDLVSDAWVATSMKDTCCGCGMVVFRVVDVDAGTAQLELNGFHVGCDDGTVFTIELIQETCCTLNIGCCDPSNPNQQPVPMSGITFRAKDADIKKICNGALGDCSQNFKVWVGCGSCPSVICGCCCLAQSAPAWIYNIPDGSPPAAFTDRRWNGSWVLTLDTGCRWVGSCSRMYSSGGTTDTATLEYISSGGVYRLTHNGSVYEMAVADWKCCQKNSMPRVSGTEGPNPLIVYPLLPNGECSECTPPDSIKVTLNSHGHCLSIDGTYTLTKHGSGSTATWDYTAPGGTTVGVLTINLSCINSNWNLAVSGQCDPLIPAPFTASITAKPASQSFAPFEVIWTGQNIAAGGNPGPVPGCCNDCTGCLDADVHE